MKTTTEMRDVATTYTIGVPLTMLGNAALGAKSGIARIRPVCYTFLPEGSFREEGTSRGTGAPTEHTDIGEERAHADEQLSESSRATILGEIQTIARGFAGGVTTSSNRKAHAQ